MTKLNFIGYYKKPFDFCYITDKMLIDSMLPLRDDSFLFTDWNDVNSDLSCLTFDLKRREVIQSNFNDADVNIILEIPTKTSTHVSLQKVFPILQTMAELNLPGINSAKTFVNFQDKSYLWKNPNLPFPRTYYADENSDLVKILSNLSEDVIVKPTDTDGGYGVVRLPNNYSAVRENINFRKQDSPFMIQEYLPEISEGERSLFFFNKKFKYAMLKKPKQDQFKCNEDCVESLTRYYPLLREIEIARQALVTMNTASVLERVDMTSSGKIMEMTIDCPGLYLVEAGVENEIGNWFYESIDAVKKH